MRLQLRAGLLAAIMSVAGLSVGAVPLAPGGSVGVTSTSPAADAELAGGVLEDRTASSLIYTDPPFIGSFLIWEYQDRLLRSDLTGDLIFTPRILAFANVTTGQFQVTALEIFGYGNFATDLAYRTDSEGDRGPTFAERSADGETLRFEFGFPLIHGNLAGQARESSYFLSIKTDATDYAPLGRASIFGRHLDYPGQEFRFDFGGVYVPVEAAPAIPLPASGLLLLMGPLALWQLKRRR